ncbi:MAG: DUF1015 domain-containing protein [Clostridia bacterium]|nr:DUF1015 domain-containing protein [Clostridia bacterium]
MNSKKTSNSGVHIPPVLLPGKNTNLTKWSVVACDQYTSQEDYWKDVENYVGNDYSTLHLIFPEVYLEKDDKDERVSKINAAMEQYVNEGILVTHNPCFIYLDRKTAHVPSRKGLIIAVDLEEYEYAKGSQSLIRATEGTVIERLPPRVKVRENALLELPHIMLLIDDPERSVIEPLALKTESFEKVYDFDLMMGSGHITGFKIESEETISSILQAINALAAPETFRKKYGVGEDKGVLLFAVGDGNHSLATAKVCWENLKQCLSPDELENHPARYALVELVNVHDEGLVFEPIHRVVFNVDTMCLLNSLKHYFMDKNCRADYKFFASEGAMKSWAEEARLSGNRHVIPFISKDSFGIVAIDKPPYNLEVGTLQSFLDDFMKDRPDVKIDYIHGADVVASLGSKEGNMGFFLPAMNKHDLFKTVILDGALPRKTFSMGEADEKRFYLECRKIR